MELRNAFGDGGRACRGAGGDGVRHGVKRRALGDAPVGEDDERPIYVFT